MQTLADMGRIFNDEDEAKLIKLTEDLTAWMNKYADTFEDPESLLFQTTMPLMTEEMLIGGENSEELIVEPENIIEEILLPETEQSMESSISISFSFSQNNGDWFTYESNMTND